MDVRPKKRLGQHFLSDKKIAERIVGHLMAEEGDTVVEIGPGTGILTDILIKKFGKSLYAVEVDEESVDFLNNKYPELASRILLEDFLRINLKDKFGKELSIVGNFPYNISSQILFQVLHQKQEVKELVGMFQREVGRRVCTGPGSKEYGILSVLIGAFFEASYLFTVSEKVFIPPPKVKSGVIRLVRKEGVHLPCTERGFFRVVKMSFNQRRKTLRNSLSSLILPENRANTLFDKRPEQLSVEEFLELTEFIESQSGATLDGVL